MRLLDKILEWAVVVAPTVLGLWVAFVPVGADSPTERSRKWRYGVISAAVIVSMLTWWQQRRADDAHDREVQTQTQALRDVAVAIAQSNTALQTQMTSLIRQEEQRPDSGKTAKEIAGRVAGILSARRIDAPIAARLVRVLRNSPKPSSINIMTASGDAEAFQYATQLLNILRTAGWNALGPVQGRYLCPPPSAKCRPLTGIALEIADANRVPPGANELAGALKSAGILAVGMTVHLNVNDSPIQLIVGSKPSP